MYEPDECGRKRINPSETLGNAKLNGKVINSKDLKL